MRYTLIFFLFILSACGSQLDFLKPAAGKAVENVTCNNSQSRLYDVLYASLVDLQKIPTEDELQTLFEKSLEEHPDIHLNRDEFLKLVGEFYQIVLNISATNPKEMLEKLTALEVGDQTTVEAQRTQNELKVFQTKWDQFTAQQDVACGDHPPAIISPVEGGTELQSRSVDYGARKVLATAYQSCSAVEKAPMTLATPDVEGISRVGTHSDGVGSKRAITDLSAVQKTDYYLQNLAVGANCRDIRKTPLIYDYGGKPYSSSDPDSPMDLFKNMGTGTSVLGIDCSGYVFTSIATAGLKFDPGKKVKPILVHGINARMYMNPAANGMPCFDKVSMGVSGTLKAGDIMAIPGHVTIIESVGADPFGISRISSIDQCSSLNADHFNFVIAQSSPSKNGIGINRYSAKDYLAEEPSIQEGFEKYARDACKAKFQKKDVLMQASNFQIVRHKMTAACMDKPVTLVGETCVNSCRSLVSSAKLYSSQGRTE